MNKKVIALSLFFIFGIACFSIVSFTEKDNSISDKELKYMEVFGIYSNPPLHKNINSINQTPVKYLQKKRVIKE